MPREAPMSTPHSDEHVRTDGEINVDDAIGSTEDPPTEPRQ
jgi:hypothetical protein